MADQINRQAKQGGRERGGRGKGEGRERGRRGEGGKERKGGGGCKERLGQEDEAGTVWEKHSGMGSG